MNVNRLLFASKVLRCPNSQSIQFWRQERDINPKLWMNQTIAPSPLPPSSPPNTLTTTPVADVEPPAGGQPQEPGVGGGVAPGADDAQGVGDAAGQATAADGNGSDDVPSPARQLSVDSHTTESPTRAEADGQEAGSGEGQQEVQGLPAAEGAGGNGTTEAAGKVRVLAYGLGLGMGVGSLQRLLGLALAFDR